MKYKAIGFDYGGVIKGAVYASFLKDICTLLGITYEEYRAVFYRHNRQVNIGEISWEELWERFLDELGQPEKLQQVLKIFRASTPKEIDQQLLFLVDTLRRKGYKVGLLSNNTAAVGKEMQAEGLDDHFDVMHVSAVTSFVKPEAEAFLYFAKALDVKIDELVFIDDSHNSLSTAGEIGYTPIVFTTYSKLTVDLRAIGIDIDVRPRG